jgi:hypothetical protein
MKRGVLGIIAALCISLLTPAFAATPPKTGEKCTSLNKKLIYKNYQYTCIKKSGKLVWSKGVLIKKEVTPIAAPSSTPSPTLSPTPTPTTAPSPSESPSPSAAPTPTPTPTPTLDEATFVFQDICEKDPFIPSQWKGLEEQINGRGSECSWPYRIVQKSMPTITPTTTLIENQQNIDVCKIKQNPSKLNILAWPTEHVDFWMKYERHPSLNSVIQLIPIYSSDAPDNKNNPLDDYKPYLDFLKDWVVHASDGAGKLTVRSPERYIEFPEKLSNFNLIHERPQADADKFRAAIEKYIVPKIDFSGANIAIIVTPAGTRATISQQLGINQISANNNFIKLTMMPPKTWNDLNVPSSNFFHPAWWLHELHHVTAGFDDNDHTSSAGLHWWGLMSYGASEMLGWHKWLIGFWGDAKIHCVDTSMGGTYWIAPSTYQTTKRKLLVLPISSTKVAVVESMRAGGLNYKMPTWMEGALVYVVDTSRTATHEGMYVSLPSSRKITNRTLPSISRAFQNSDAALKLGESTTVGGYKITIVESGTFGDVVKVERV